MNRAIVDHDLAVEPHVLQGRVNGLLDELPSVLRGDLELDPSGGVEADRGGLIDGLDELETLCRLVCADTKCRFCDVIENDRMRCILKRVAIGKDGICLAREVRKEDDVESSKEV